MSQPITITTSDRVILSARWNTAPTTLGGIVLAHMYPSTKESWASFQEVLASRGIASLAIDLRGHGESVKTTDGQTLDYRKFSDAEHLASMEDLRAAYEWMEGRNIESDTIAVAGASIGANFALRLLAEDPRIPAALLLSPGLNYHGVTVEDMIPFVNPHQSVLVVASRGDDDESAHASEQIIASLAVETKEKRILQNAGHGMRMIEGDAALMGELADWLRDHIQLTG